MREVIHSPNAPAAIGTYSQAVRVGKTVYLSGQIPLNPTTMVLCSEDIAQQIEQVIQNLKAVCEAAGSGLQNLVRVGVFLTDLTHFPLVNEAMAKHFTEPYPARAAIGVASLPKGAQVEMDGILVLD